MKGLLSVLVCLGMVLLSGCTTVTLSDTTTIQGTWKGQEVRDGQAVTSWLTLTGREVEFRGAEADDWFKGTFTLREDTNPKQFMAVIKQCPQSSMVGRTINAIYQLEMGPPEPGTLASSASQPGTLVITANRPGNPTAPASFGDRHARQIVFTRD